MTNVLRKMYDDYKVRIFSSDQIIEEIQKELDNGYDVNQIDRFDGFNCLMHYISSHHKELFDKKEQICKFLIDNGANINYQVNDKIHHPKSYIGLTPLITAIHRFEFDVIKLLVNKGANVNIRDSFGRSPLMHVIETSSTCYDSDSVYYGVNKNSKYRKDILYFLIKNGADINAVDNKGRNVLYYIVQVGSPAY